MIFALSRHQICSRQLSRHLSTTIIAVVYSTPICWECQQLYLLMNLNQNHRCTTGPLVKHPRYEDSVIGPYEQIFEHKIVIIFLFISLTLNAPIETKVVCFSHLLKCIRSLYGKQCGPRSDCSYRSSLFWVHAVCFYT